MADLPDLDTTEIGVIAYWNQLDNTDEDTYDPENSLDDSDVVEYTLYDNGVDGRQNLSQRADERTVNFRTKNDGWIIAWMDRTNEFEQDVSGSPLPQGYYDMMDDWKAGNSSVETSSSSLVDGTLADVIQTHAETSLNTDNISHYCYEYPDATTFTGLSAQDDAGNTLNPSLSYTDSTTIEYWAATGASADSSNYVRWEGYDIETGWNYGTIDVLALGLSPNAGTEYSGTASESVGDNVKMDHLVMWH